MKLPHRIFTLWIGDAPMSENRRNALFTIRRNTGVRIEFITNDTLENYILDEHPLHPAYKYLTNTHKADYLRAYLMNYHGGGYTDIKYTFYPWNHAFEQLEQDNNKWIAGYTEFEWGVAPVEDPELNRTLRENWSKLVGNGAYICKPDTPFTREWLKNVENTLDKYMSVLPSNQPKHSRDYQGLLLEDGTISTYPINWSEIHGSIFHPLCYKYIDNLLHTVPPPILVGYM